MDLKNNLPELFSRVLITLFATVTISVKIPAQQVKDVPATSNGNILFFVDHTGFKGEENKTYEEFYLMIPADQIGYKTIDGKKQGAIKIKSYLKDGSGKVISTKEWITETTLPEDTSMIKGLAIYDQWSPEMLNPGIYKTEIEIADQNSTNKGTASFDVQIFPFQGRDFSASQIEFVTRIEENKQPNQFTKGKLIIIPNPSRRYGILNPVLYLYYELYNIPAADKNLSVIYSIKSMDSQLIKTFPAIKIKRPGESTTVFHGVNVAAIPSGVYDLQAEVFDSSNEKTLSISRSFEVMQFTQAKVQQPQPQMSDEQAEIGGRIIQYIAPDKYSYYEKLDLNGKGQFLIRFWNEIDPSPGTSENEYLERIINRYQYANQNFGWGKVEGWATDRGRILIKYGNPDEIERHEFETNAVPYEIWYYRQDKSYMFVFADLKSNGRYSLLHSTKEGEVNNPYWTEQVKQM